MKRTGGTMTDVLRKAIAESGIAHIELERQTGVNRASIMRFLRGETSLRLDLADRLAAYFGPTVQPNNSKRKGK